MMPVLHGTCRNVIAAFSCLLFPLFCFAAETLPQPELQSPFSSALQMLLGLGIVLLAIASMAWLLKKFMPGQVAANGDLRVVSAVAVGAKERVVLVDVGETRLVLGVAPGHVIRLLEMPRPEQAVQTQVATNSKPFVIKLKEVIASRGETK